MKSKNTRVNLDPKDIHAIISALGLVASSDSGNATQNMVNETSCKTAFRKLSTNQLTFTPNELRVIYVSLGFALDLISGIPNPYVSMDELEPDWQAELKQNYFIYNRLYPVFEKLTDRFD